jgi:uncharacterized protein (DUF2336 family)
MLTSQSLVAELENTLNHGESVQRRDILRKVTDLFLRDAGCYDEECIAVFDGVMVRLIEKIERQALIELSGRLAPIRNAPAAVIRRLAHDPNIGVWQPVLKYSDRLTDPDLVDLAKTKSQAHLVTIAGRARLSETVTDVLIDRGNEDVRQEVTLNSGARISSLGLAKVAGHAEVDERLAVAFANRKDVPPEVLEQLVRRATDVVRQRLVEDADPAARGRIQEILSSVSDHVARNEASHNRLAAGRSAKVLMHQDPGRLKEQIWQFAKDGKPADTINGLAMLCNVPVGAVKNIVSQGSAEGLIILGKAGGLGWPELKDVLIATVRAKTEKSEDLKALFEQFMSLSAHNAQRVVRFIKSSNAVSKDAIRKMI